MKDLRNELAVRPIGGNEGTTRYYSEEFISGWDARDKLDNEALKIAVEALEKIKPALNIAFEDCNDLYYKNVESDLNEALVEIRKLKPKTSPKIVENTGGGVGVMEIVEVME